MIELWVAETAAAFWEEAGGLTEDFETAVAFNLPLTRQNMSELTLHKACVWLQQQGLPLNGLDKLADRSLRACLVAHGGQRNFVLLDDTDPPADQLFSLAHEVAHFLLDYELPRRRAVRSLGNSALEVLDGQRLPNLEERLSGWLDGIKIEPHRHFMERNGRGDILSRETLAIEDRADQLALELLAPQEKALSLVSATIKGINGYTKRLQVATAALTSSFDLPEGVAQSYTKQLIGLAGGNPSFAEWIQS